MNLVFWRDAGERALRAAAASAAPLIAAAQLALFSLDWEHVLESAAGAAVFSLVMSLAGAKVSGSPSLIPAAKNVNGPPLQPAEFAQ